MAIQTTAKMVQDFVGDARGKRYAIGNAIFSDARSAGIIGDDNKPLQKGVTVAEWFVAECNSLKIRVDVAFVAMCLSTSREGKRASKADVYKEWLGCTSDSEARQVVESAEGKDPRKKPAQKSDLEKALSAVAKLTPADKAVVFSMLQPAVKTVPMDTTLTPSDTFEVNSQSDVEDGSGIGSLARNAVAYAMAQHGPDTAVECFNSILADVIAVGESIGIDADELPADEEKALQDAVAA